MRVKQERKIIDLNVTQSSVYFDLADYAVFTVHGFHLSGTWGTAILTVTRSNDGLAWYAMESATTLGPGAAMTAAIDSLGFTRLRVQVSTVEGAAGTAEITLVAKGDA